MLKGLLQSIAVLAIVATLAGGIISENEIINTNPNNGISLAINGDIDSPPEVH